MKMAREPKPSHLSRRSFLQQTGWASAAFLSSPLVAVASALSLRDNRCFPPFALAEPHITPHYPADSPLEDVLRLAMPGQDEFLTEKFAFEIDELLKHWSHDLREATPAIAGATRFLSPSLEASSLSRIRETQVRKGGVQVTRRQFAADVQPGRDRFLEELKSYFSPFSQLVTAEFLIVRIEAAATSPDEWHIDIRYDLVGVRTDRSREERIGLWKTHWSHEDATGWIAHRWEATEETVSRSRAPVFLDATNQAFGEVDSYRNQLLHGVDYWRTVLDSACGINVYGNNGIAAGDFDNDGVDDLYICQPSGLPNRLFRNRGDGTFEDVTEKCGVGVLDGTACALFADFENKGLQDLLVVCASGPQLFVNQGNGKFSRKRDAFKFVRPPEGTFTHAAIADYDGDGKLDVYFCLYSYYLGLDQYHYPTPYFDARNGPPNFLLHNEGDATFRDVTRAAGLDADNNRYSFACAWGNTSSSGHPDLYIANDFGLNNLYRNNGDGTFTSVATEAHVEDVGAGMSATWFDYDNDGNQDVYVSNMWSAAGLRVSQEKPFHEKDSEEVRALYRRHARGNSLYRNLGNGRFQNVSAAAGVEMGRWAWSSDAWDFDHDGYPDLYIANGYISGPDTRDLGSFFWRQVVGKSPSNVNPSPNYEHGWNAINELIRSDYSWSGYERNVAYLNNQDGTFSEVSGVLGLDFPDDSRSFSLADLDHDGRLEIILKNRNAPQLRVLRNVMQDLGSSLAFLLRGHKSNRDAIGTAVTVEAGGRRQTKYLQAGTGFLSQHTKELFFGLGDVRDSIRATVRWPSGLVQTFDQVPTDHRIKIEEGIADFKAHPFAPSRLAAAESNNSAKPDPLPSAVATWLIQPLAAPEFSLPDLSGTQRSLSSFRGYLLLLYFWASSSPSAIDQLRTLQLHDSALSSPRVRMVAINIDDPPDLQAIRTLADKAALSFPILLATQETAGIYNIIYRYLFDRRRDLPLPTAFLLDETGMILRVYQGPLDAEQVVRDSYEVPRTPEDRIRKALPFVGLVPDDGFQRNDFTYGVALFQHGYLDQAAESFKQVVAAKPQDPEAYYNLGTVYLRRNDLADARHYLEQTVQLRPNYPEAWNNLGMLAAQEGHPEEATRNFQESLRLRPDYTVALLNLGNLLRRSGDTGQATKMFSRALELEPENPEVNYSYGMLYARADQLSQALQYLEKAVVLRPDYADALNNLGVLLVRQQRYGEAEERLKTCIRVAPNFDQGYLNLARLYVVMKDEQKAREVLQALLRLQPDHKMAQQALEMLH